MISVLLTLGLSVKKECEFNDTYLAIYDDELYTCCEKKVSYSVDYRYLCISGYKCSKNCENKHSRSTLFTPSVFVLVWFILLCARLNILLYIRMRFLPNTYFAKEGKDYCIFSLIIYYVSLEVGYFLIFIGLWGMCYISINMTGSAGLAGILIGILIFIFLIQNEHKEEDYKYLPESDIVFYANSENYSTFLYAPIPENKARSFYSISLDLSKMEPLEEDKLYKLTIHGKVHAINRDFFTEFETFENDATRYVIKPSKWINLICFEKKYKKISNILGLRAIKYLLILQDAKDLEYSVEYWHVSNEIKNKANIYRKMDLEIESRMIPSILGNIDLYAGNSECKPDPEYKRTSPQYVDDEIEEIAKDKLKSNIDLETIGHVRLDEMMVCNQCSKKCVECHSPIASRARYDVMVCRECMMKKAPLNKSCFICHQRCDELKIASYCQACSSQRVKCHICDKVAYR